MAGETTLTITGNLVDDPELRHTPSGHAVAKFRIASTPRTYDKQSGQWQDGESLFMTVSAWRALGENVAASVQRGTRVVVVGTLRQRTYEDNQGIKRTVVEVEAEEVAPSLRNATAQVTKTTGNRQGGNSQQQQSGYGPQQPQYDQWNTNGPAY
ncbi:ssDNA binding protein [Streptomyces phage PapayaSalad]|uniref:Single-stranded DNA-binding protein n=1 Tax=Streptomyces phage PapayaSalad TaxID=1920310 RepID=A0A1J0MC89_9CAUD|nr:single-stranded DNA-binding protein [Streptomyces phage PapayaSalad]APD18639.1 ssDNA binding protein [Streptomyces phage PapayaSalad]